MKLEVGMYVRTKKGIAKVIKIDDLDNVAWTDKKDIYFGVNRETGYLDWYIYDDGTVLKASHNIIDLIEVGDYVNGKPVAEIYEDEKIVTLNDNDKGWRTMIKEKEIKTILTKEQFENNCYKVGDE